ncbi:unnamed protein product, partial [Ectocarpus sp. 12 AP-2014]
MKAEAPITARAEKHLPQQDRVSRAKRTTIYSGGRSFSGACCRILTTKDTTPW